MQNERTDHAKDSDIKAEFGGRNISRRDFLKIAGITGVAIGAGAGLSGIVGACGSGSSATGAGGTTSPGAKQVRIAFVAAQANTVFQTVHKGIMNVANQQGVTVDWLDNGFDAQKAFNVVQDVTAGKNYNAMIVIPVDSIGIVPAVQDAIAAGIKVVNTNVPLGKEMDTSEPQLEGQTGSVVESFKQYALGQADLIIGAAGDLDPCRVGWIAGYAGLPFEVYERKVREEALKAHPNIELVASLDGGHYLVEKGYALAQDLIRAHPDLHIIGTIGDAVGKGAQMALADAGMAGKMTITGVGASKTGIAATRDGTWYGTVMYAPIETGQYAADMVIRAARGEDIHEGFGAVLKGGYPPTFNHDNMDKFSAGFTGEWAC